VTDRVLGRNVTSPAVFLHDEDIEAPVKLSPKEVPNLGVVTDEDFSKVSRSPLLLYGYVFICVVYSCIRSLRKLMGGGQESN
jgi:hypothetical protein